MPDLDLQRIESRTWRVTQRDGLFDLFFAVIFLGLSMSQLADALFGREFVALGLLVGVEALGVGGLCLGRRLITRPRLGVVRFAPFRKRRLRAMRVFLALCVAATIAVVVMTGLASGGFARPVTRTTVSAVAAALILVPLAAIAYVQEFPRLLVHAMLFVAAEFGGTWLESTGGVPFPRAVTFGVAFAVSAVLGTVLFVRFLRETRVPEGADRA